MKRDKLDKERGSLSGWQVPVNPLKLTDLRLLAVGVGCDLSNFIVRMNEFGKRPLESKEAEEARPEKKKRKIGDWAEDPIVIIGPKESYKCLVCSEDYFSDFLVFDRLSLFFTNIFVKASLEVRAHILPSLSAEDYRSEN